MDVGWTPVGHTATCHRTSRVRQTLVAFLLLLLSSSLSAQVRIDVGIAAGQQSYEQQDLGSQFLISPEVLLSRGRLALYYNLDRANLSSSDLRRGTMWASHVGFAYRWPIGRNLAVRAGAGPSYVTITYLGGEPTWHAQLELALRKGRLEWFAKVRQYEFSASKFRVAGARSEEHTSELQSQSNLVCRLLLEKKKNRHTHG